MAMPSRQPVWTHWAIVPPALTTGAGDNRIPFRLQSSVRGDSPQVTRRVGLDLVGLYLFYEEEKAKQRPFDGSE